MAKYSLLTTVKNVKKNTKVFFKGDFDAASKKYKRRLHRKKNILLSNVSSKTSLSPIVHCQTNMHNSRIKIGKGFSLKCLKKLKISPKFARSKGIKFDDRKKKSTNLDKQNIDRLVSFFKKKNDSSLFDNNATESRHPLIKLLEIGTS